MRYFDKIPSLSGPALHFGHILQATLTVLFLILPAVSGPKTNYWWLTITYPVPAAATGSQWRFGGLGVCKVGQECIANPDNVPVTYGPIKAALTYHFAAAAMFFVVALVEYGLIRWPGGRPVCSGWTTLLLLFAGPLLVITAMMVDLIIRAKIMSDEAIDSVNTEPCFWLSVMAAISALFWAISVASYRQRVYGRTGHRISAENEARARKQRARANEAQRQAHEKAQKRVGLRGLWPW